MKSEGRASEYLVAFFYKLCTNFSTFLVVHFFLFFSCTFLVEAEQAEQGPQIGEGNGNPLQYSCLENPMDRGAWWAAVHGITQSQT